jgi:hypothetical protein
MMGMRISLGKVVTLLVLMQGAGGQDLAELARREKQRRRTEMPPRVRIEQVSPERGSLDGDPSEPSSRVTGWSKQFGKPSRSMPEKPSADAGRMEYLRRRGPEVKEKISTEKLQLEQRERELEESARNHPPLWRQGRRIEDSRVVALRRETERGRKRLQDLERELRTMEEEVRRRNWRPGILRGQLP